MPRLLPRGSEEKLAKPQLQVSVVVDVPRLAGRRRTSAVVVYSVANALSSVTAGVLAILYATAFSLREYGTNGVLSATIAVLGIAGDMGIPPAILRNYYDARQDAQRVRAFLASVVRGSRLLFVLSSPVLGLLLYVFWDALGIGRTRLWVLLPLLLLISFADRFVTVLAVICRARERPAHFAIGRVVQGGVTIVAAYVLVIVCRAGVPGALLASLLGLMSSMLAYRILLAGEIGGRDGPFAWTETRACLKFGLPLVPNRLAGWGRQLALRPLLTHLVALNAVGLFSFASAVAALPSLLATGVDLALSPVYFRKRVAGSEEFTTKMMEFSVIFVAVQFPVWVFAIMFCSDVIGLVAGGRYAAAAPACAALLCAAYLRSHIPFLLRQIHFHRETWVLPLISIPCAAFSILATVLLAPTYGITAVGWAVACADTAMLVALAGAIRHYEHLNYPLVMSLALGVILVALAAWVGVSEPVPANWSKVAVKGLIGVAALLASGATWIWPRRTFIRQLAAG